MTVMHKAPGKIVFIYKSFGLRKDGFVNCTVDLFFVVMIKRTWTGFWVLRPVPEHEKRQYVWSGMLIHNAGYLCV